MVETTLPSPNCAFSIPNLNDDLELNCRLYFPKQNPSNDDTLISGFAVVAHPYAPLGGCYDDPVVQLTTSTLLGQGFVACTFNFRGAMTSSGNTSWTGRAELGDYVSVYAFMLRLMNVPDVIEHVKLTDNKPLLILGGYSYGSMIASHLPPLQVVRELFSNGQEGYSDLEIMLRAQEMAKVLLSYLETQTNRGRHSLRADDNLDPSNSIMVGGYDSEHSSSRARRNSSRRSVDIERVRHSIDRFKGRLSLKGKYQMSSQQDLTQNFPRDDQSQGLVEPEIAFLLISPLLQPVAGFTTMFSRLVFERKNSPNNAKTQRSWLLNLSENPTIAIYGDRDTFTSAHKLRKWTQELQSAPRSRFTSQEIAGAGHFWQESGAYERLHTIISTWSTSLRARNEQSNE